MLSRTEGLSHEAELLRRDGFAVYRPFGATECGKPGVLENELAYVRYDNNSLSRGHVLASPERHVASFFDMTTEEQSAILGLLNEAQRLIQRNHSPDGYNIGVNIGQAGGQSRMHVHVHLIPRYVGDVVDPGGGIRCVLARRTHGA